MNSIIDYVDNLISTLSDNPAFSGYNFKKVYVVGDYDPVHNEFTAVFNIDEVKCSDSFISGLFRRNTLADIYKARLVIRLYGGNTVSGNSLTRSAVKLKKAVLQADSGGFINSAVISPIKYESKTGAVYRELVFNIEYVLCEAVV